MDRKTALFMTTAAICVGAVAFIAGYVGPVALDPKGDPAQGPLAAFFTGPTGVAIGALLGLAAAARNLRWFSFLILVAATGLVVAISILILCLPADHLEGEILDAQVLSCSTPDGHLPKAIAQWEDSVAFNKGLVEPRRGWRDDTPALVAGDPGVVLTITVYRKREVYELRKPWNLGRLRSPGWQQVNLQRNYFARYGGAHCSSYLGEKRGLYSPVWEHTSTFPPNTLPAYLSLQVLKGVPARFQVYASG